MPHMLRHAGVAGQQKNKQTNCAVLSFSPGFHTSNTNKNNTDSYLFDVHDLGSFRNSFSVVVGSAGFNRAPKFFVSFSFFTFVLGRMQ
jgi:hypothetical protein